MMEQFNFFKIALSDFQTGALARSSKYVVNAVARNFNDELLHRVIEYGPGDGVVTREILKRMHPNGELTVVETNPKFIEILSEIGDPRLNIIEGTAQQISEKFKHDHLESIDLVISSIPFSILNHLDREQIVSSTFNMLKDAGKFVVFHQYSLLMLELLNKYFNHDKIGTQFEPRNILPCFIMSAEK